LFTDWFSGGEKIGFAVNSGTDGLGIDWALAG
jgi:hypothetical protein